MDAEWLTTSHLRRLGDASQTRWSFLFSAADTVLGSIPTPCHPKKEKVLRFVWVLFFGSPNYHIY